MRCIAVCHTCGHRHRIEFGPEGPGNQFSDWLLKHPCPHVVTFHNPRRRACDGRHTPAHSFEGYIHNADVKIAFGTAATGTGGITSLATSSTWTAGYEWYIVDNSTDKALARHQQINARVGTTPTASTEIRIYAVGSYDGTTWPDVFDGTPSAETVTSEGIRDGFAKLAAVMRCDSTTSNRDYPAYFDVAQVFGGVCPKKVAIFLAHNTGVNLNSTGSTHTYADQPYYVTSI